jgi:MoaD family protein
MIVHVRYTAQLRAAAGLTEEAVELAPGSSVADLLRHLAGRHSQAAAHLLVSPAQVRPSLLVVVNEGAVPARQTAATALHDGDVILLLPPIAGG